MVISARQFLINSLKRRESVTKVASAITALRITSADSTLGKALYGLEYKYSSSISNIDDFSQYYAAPESIYDAHDDYDVVIPAQLDTFKILFPLVDASNADNADPHSHEYATTLQALIFEALKDLGVNTERFRTAFSALLSSHDHNWSLGSSTSKKIFIKKLRFLNRLERKVDTAQEVLKLRHAQMQAKSRFAHKIDGDKLDNVTLSYVAYLTARANRRSLFMFGPQSKAFDNITDDLFNMLPSDAAWDQIALVHPTKIVFNHLDKSQIDYLAGMFHTEMSQNAKQLKTLYTSFPSRMKKEMVMVKGVDSSRWNAYAGSFNTMRSAWINAFTSRGLSSIFDAYLPGKAPRLMASDLVWGYRNRGEDLQSDTVLFHELPHPWDVISGKVNLNREDIIKVAKENNITDYNETGWVSPRAAVETEQSSITPISLHGVVISDPELALQLKKVRAFSGKTSSNLNDIDLVSFERDEVIDKNGSITPIVK